MITMKVKTHEKEGHYMKCPCDSGFEFGQCCEPFLLGASAPETAEKLMRSRYTAFVRADMDYIKRTLAPESRRDFDMEANRKWAKESKWHGLKILSTKDGGATGKTGIVEFIATFEQDGQALEHHEVAKFRRGDNGTWLFVEGDSHTHPQGEGHAHSHAKPETHRREQPKVGRNDACVCGSGKKYKKCCGGAA